MKVLIGECIHFDDSDADKRTARVHGDYKIVEMSQAEFESWADMAPDDYITEEYNGHVQLCRWVSSRELFELRRA
jgi:hypothetical protein